MIDDGEDISVTLYKALQQPLVSRGTALAYARMLIADRFGEDEVLLQEPFVVDENEGNWIVRGSRQPNWADGLPRNALRHGPAEVVIAQSDGRITKLTVDAPLPPAEPD